MTSTFKNALVAIARERITDDDPSHDFGHAKRVMILALKIGEKERADLQVLVPSALFHDLVIIQKDEPDAHLAPHKSADAAAEILRNLPGYPEEKIPAVRDAICQCCFGKEPPVSLEARVLQDADHLESTGAISIMRTFAYSAVMKRPFFNSADPFCDRRAPEPFLYALDLFYTRLLKITEHMHTRLGRQMAEERERILHQFLESLSEELADLE